MHTACIYINKMRLLNQFLCLALLHFSIPFFWKKFKAESILYNIRYHTIAMGRLALCPLNLLRFMPVLPIPVRNKKYRFSVRK